jgi:hypothetical protein
MVHTTWSLFTTNFKRNCPDWRNDLVSNITTRILIHKYKFWTDNKTLPSLCIFCLSQTPLGGTQFEKH